MRFVGRPVFGIFGATGVLLVALPAQAGADRHSPTAAQQRPNPALATGESARGAVRWRLEGRRLTLRLRAPLGPVALGSRRVVEIACGDEAEVGAGTGRPEELEDAMLGAEARATLRLTALAGRHVLRIRLSDDVAAQANWCGLRVSGRVRFESARMTLRRGRPVRCVAQDEREVVAENERALVTLALRTGLSYIGVYRGCRKPAGRWQTLDRVSVTNPDTDISPTDFTLAGPWVAWRTERTGWWCTLSRRNLAGGDTELVVAPPEPAQPDDRCVTQLALGATGAVAWVERQRDLTEQVKAQRPGGATVTLTAGAPAGSATDLAISADEATVTWLEAGQARSARLPSAG